MDDWSSSSSVDSDLENPDDDALTSNLKSLPRRSKRRRLNLEEGDGISLGSNEETDRECETDEPQAKKASRVKKRSQAGRPSTKKHHSPTVRNKNKHKRKILSKGERAEICQSLKDIDISSTLQQVESSLREQASNHPGVNEILGDLIKNDSLCRALMEHHITTFVDLYNQCSTGKEKYLRFQLKWHSHCSIFLLPKDVDVESVLPKQSLGKEDIRTYENIRSLWQQFCDTSYPFENCKKLMILFSSILYKMLLQKVNEHPASSTNHQTSIPTHVVHDADDVYYRFGGAALSDMLHVRYNKVKKSSVTVSEEISILQAINTKDKSSMPNYLKYRDRGYMYTPHSTFIPFLRDVDKCVQEVVNPTGFQNHADEIVKVAHALVKTRTELKEKFMKLLKDKMSSYSTLNGSAIDNVYDEFVRKLCNTRIQEFLSVQKQKFASDKGHASTKAQNLRDTLLTQHSNLQCRFKID